MEDASALKEDLKRLATGVVHDFSNLLAIIQGHAHLCLDELAYADPKREDLLAILDAAERGSQLTGQLSAFGGNVQRASPRKINDLVREVQPLVERVGGEETTLSFKLEATEAHTMLGAKVVGEVLVGLVLNAIYDMPNSSGDVGVRTHHVEVKPTDDIDLTAGPYLAISVHHKGALSTADEQKSLLRPYAKKRSNRPGLGLDAIEALARAHGGTVHVDEAASFGRCLTFLVPAEENLVKPKPQKTQSSGAQKKKKILVIDDEMLVCRSISRTLSRTGVFTEEVNDPVQAIEVIRRSLDDYSVLITDVNMGSVSGFQVAAEARQIDPNFPVLVLSGLVSPEDQLLCSENNYIILSKPYSVHDLRKKIAEILEDDSQTNGRG